MQSSITVKNAQLDAIEATVGASPTLEIRTGAAPASCAAADTGAALASFALPADWMVAANNNLKSLAGSWQDPSADATGVAGHWRIKVGAVCHLQGSCSMAEGGGDMILQNTNIAVGQPVTITQFDLYMD